MRKWITVAVGVKRTRWLLLGSFAAVLAAVGAFFLAGYLRQQKLKRDLPSRLGLDIQQDSSGFTVSKSQNGHTLFTLHAARAIQFKTSGQASLKDVQITIYGPAGSAQQDRIAGADFSYDQKTGVAIAKGPVSIDLEGVLAGAAKRIEGQPPTQADRERGTIHAKTIGLTFDQRTGIAETVGEVQFHLPQGNGRAIGAHYDSNTGELVLGSNVVLHGAMSGSADTLTASHAVLERQNRGAHLDNATLHSNGRMISAGHAVARFDDNGALQQVTAENNVLLQGLNGEQASAPRGEAEFGPGSAVREAYLHDGVTFTRVQPGEVTHGKSQSARIWFGADKKAERVRLTGQVDVTEDVAASRRSRSLRSADLLVSLAGGKPSRAEAQGAPVMLETAQVPKGEQQRDVSGDFLTATFTPAGVMQHMHAAGHSRLEEHSPDGSRQDSTGDILDADFASNTVQDSLQLAVQQGHVAMHRTATRDGKPTVENATADRATYRAVEDTVLLEGSPRLSDETLDLSGNAMTLFRAKNALEVRGPVQGTYASQGSGDATHVTAASATIDNDRHIARFVQNARLWQGSNVLEAPEITLLQSPRRLTARSQGTALVKANFVQQPQNGSHSPPQPAFVVADKLDYDDSARRADFTGDVQLRNADGTVHASQMQVYLAKGAQVASSQPPDFSGRLERAVAEDNVRVQQPGRIGMGDQLTYTAADGSFLLTGSAVRPPRLEDRQKGTVTGESIKFWSKDERVVVTSGNAPAVTDTVAGSK